MENFIVSARKYRPTNFESVVGQQSITTTLKNAIRKKQLAHAYLFFGPRGVGKTTCARILAKTINCLNPTDNQEACNECESCKSFNENRSFNIHELDAASNNSVEDIRNLIDQVRIPPQIGKYSIYIIDEVHMLSISAFNAFLKTLEEPPEHAIFILATTEKHKIIPTILSRCQIFDFNRIKVEDIVDYLAKIAKNEGIDAEKEGLNIIAQKADGAMRDALSIFDQIASFTEHSISYQDVITNLNVLDYEYYFRLSDALYSSEYIPALIILEEILSKGFDGQHFLSGLSAHFRDLLMAKDPKTISLLEVGAGIRERYLVQSKKIQAQWLIEALEVNNRFDLDYKISNNTRLHLEMCLLQLSGITEKKKDESIEHKAEKEKTSESKAETVQKNISETSQPENKNSKPKAKSYTGLLQNVSRVEEKLNSPQQNTTPSKEEDIKKEDKTEEAADETSIIEKIEFNKNNLLDLWSEFGKRYNKDEPRMLNIFSNYSPEINSDGQIELKLSNDSQIGALNEIKPQLRYYLNQRLHTDKIEFLFSLRDEEEKSDKLFTLQDKFDHLAKKNPNLLDMKKGLALDFD